MKIYVCSGKHCRKKWSVVEDALKAVGDKANVVEVKCQKICRGPVLGMKLDGQVEWFKEVDSPKSLSALEDVVAGKDLRKPLKKRWVPKRSGALRS